MIPMSVVVPTHGRTDLFLETLESLRRQTLEDFELVVSDDSAEAGDRVAIADAVEGYARRTGRPARYLFTAPRLGQARNTNQGLGAARGAFVRILHSDDLLAPRALEAELGLLRDPRLGLRMLFHHVEPFRTAPRFAATPALTLVQPSLLARSMLHSGTPLPSATVVARELLDAIGGGMREDFDFLCDWDYALRFVVAEHRRHGFIGLVSPGYVGWRLHGDSTTGRLWHRHFLEHEQLMAELAADPALAESLIGDAGTRDGFFATAVRYRYRRLGADVRGMTARQLVAAVPRLLRCLASPASLRARLTPAPWTPLGSRRYPALVVPAEVTPAHVERPRPHAFVEPRQGLRFVASAYASAAIIGWAKRHAARQGARPMAVDSQAPEAQGLTAAGRTLEIRPTMAGQPAERGRVLVLTEYNNTMNLWPLRHLVADAGTVVVTAVNGNAFAELVLHQALKFVAEDAVVEVPITDNQHLTSFGFKALIDRVAPGEFTWEAQAKAGPVHHVLRYRRRRPAHATVAAPHTGWTFGLLTTGARLENVERYVDSIAAFCDEPHEILIVSPVDLGAIARRPNVRVLPFAERDELGWITRKKNLICEQARYSDILVCHDRFSLTPDFCRDFAAWGYAYGLAAVRVRLPDGSRGLDWAVVSSQNHVWSSGGLLDYRAYSQYAYNPGGATVIRRAYWADFPWNENLFWNEHEDVELCRRVQRAGGLVALAGATLVAAEDRWVRQNPLIPYCDQNEVLYGRPVGEQRIHFLARSAA
ncbi:MAG: glycosyltransferase [Vicinamibacterales bacterium]